MSERQYAAIRNIQVLALANNDATSFTYRIDVCWDCLDSYKL
jgi:hypothetical protein